MISGLVTTEENGKIAAAGPITNLLLAAFFFGLLQLFPFISVLGVTGGIAAFVYMFLQIGYSVNAWLAFFNLIPFGPLDGVKVMRWSTQVWLMLIVIAGVMTFIRF
jgi:Zn-dependent protease